jgi:hypothetical protein
MIGKPEKSPQPAPKGDNRKTGSERTAGSNKKKLPPVPEGPENLRQRAAWFQRRTGGKSG